ncbi:MAG: fumarylacetoacetate hydrolase family protein [Thermomicrobiaceae bacterium]|nr:fumarylacetoacetate hydrolase family protein [Thermomicrobiaceae bacterium]
MQIVRFQHQGGPARVGLLEDGIVYEATGDLFGELRRGAAVAPVEDLALLPPVEPSKIVAIGLNYLDHITEDAPGFEPPENPIIFLKPPSALVGHGANIVLPRGTEQVDAEAELAVVIGRRARHVPAERAYDYVLGLTCANDVSARDYQFKDGQWARAKGFDTFAPLGPAVVTGLRAEGLAIVGRLNGEARQRSTTDKLLFGVPALIEFISGVMTLEPGDVIMTGTPAGPPRLSPGDVVEIEIEGVGTLRNPVVAEG